MPLVASPRQIIIVELSDRVISDTTVRQKATFVALNHEQDLVTGECAARITLRVSLFAKDGDGFGAQLMGNGFNDFFVELLANNNTLVDMSTGAILAIRTPDQSQQNWNLVLNSFEQNVMLQGDFFEYLRDNAPVEIGNMIRLHIAQADAMGRFH